MIPVLWHYTCQHGHDAITDTLRPGLDGYVWLTDLDAPHRDALGLTSHLLRCDRTQHRYRVTDTTDVTPYTAIRATLRPERRNGLETSGTLLRHWYVSTQRVPVIYDPRGTA